MWRELITELTPAATFAVGASAEALLDAEANLGGSLPPDLRALLEESNGVSGEYGLGLVWPIERIVSDNALFRTNPEFADLYMPFDPLLFFADAGNGDMFAFVWTPRRDEVFAWDHETDSRNWVAPSLETYLRWWLAGDLKL
jgi:hypothetical protein